MVNRRRALAASTLVTCAVALAVPAAVAAPAASGRSAPPSLCAPPADTVSPVVTKVTFGRPTVDLNTGSRTQTVTATASDASGNGAPSGVTRVYVSINGNRYYASPRLTLTSGTSADGKWTGRFAVSKYAHPGTYRVGFLDLEDAAGNQQYYDGYGKYAQSPNDLVLHPADNPTFTVTGTPATPPKPRASGTLRTFVIRPAAVDTTARTRVVRFSATFRGVRPIGVTVQVNTAKKARQDHYVYLNGRLSDHRGTWAGAVRVPRWLGTQTLHASVETRYPSGYSPGFRYYGHAQLQKLRIADQIAVVSGVDRSKPVLTSLSFTPTTVDSTNGSERVTVTAKASDTGSGLRYIDVYAGIRNGVNGVAAGAYPFAARGVGYLSSQDFDVRLTRRANGTWSGSTIVRQCVPSGTYQLNADLSDVAGNFRYYSTKQLAQAHITSTLKVTSKHGDIAPPYVYSAATYAADSEVFLNFSEGVQRVDTSTLRIYSLSPASTAFTTPTTISSITCANGKTTVDCSGTGTGGLVTSAVLTVPDLEPGTTYDVYANLAQVSPQLTDGNGNPIQSNYTATEVLGA